jgi:hypothetical protein
MRRQLIISSVVHKPIHTRQYLLVGSDVNARRQLERPVVGALAAAVKRRPRVDTHLAFSLASAGLQKAVDRPRCAAASQLHRDGDMNSDDSIMFLEYENLTAINGGVEASAAPGSWSPPPGGCPTSAEIAEANSLSHEGQPGTTLHGQQALDMQQAQKIFFRMARCGDFPGVLTRDR